MVDSPWRAATARVHADHRSRKNSTAASPHAAPLFGLIFPGEDGRQNQEIKPFIGVWLERRSGGQTDKTQRMSNRSPALWRRWIMHGCQARRQPAQGGAERRAGDQRSLPAGGNFRFLLRWARHRGTRKVAGYCAWRRANAVYINAWPSIGRR